MQPIEKTRRDRLISELRESDLNDKDFAVSIDIAPGFLSQLKMGKHAGGRNIGAKLARKIEVALGRPEGWLDTPIGYEISENGSADSVSDISAEYSADFDYGGRITNISRVPIVGTAQLGSDGYWYELDHPVGNGDGHVMFGSTDSNAYALRVRGDSMYPSIRDGWIVVVEPNSSPIPGQYVLVATTDGRKMVKEYLFDSGDAIGLESVNDRHPRLTLRKDVIEKIHYVAGILPPGKIEFD